MLVVPHQFHTARYEAFQPHLGVWSVLFLAAGGALLAAASLSPTRAVALVTHSLAAGALLALAGEFVVVAEWTGAIAYCVLGLGVALAGLVVAAGRSRPPGVAPDLFALVVAASAILNGTLLLLGLVSPHAPVFLWPASPAALLGCGLALVLAGTALLATVERRVAGVREPAAAP